MNVRLSTKRLAKRVPGAVTFAHGVRSYSERRSIQGTSEGLRLAVPKKYASRYFDTAYEPTTVAWLRSHLSDGATAVDVGAHIGFLTCFMARAVGPEGNVVAFEPDAENFRFLRRNLRLNHLAADVHAVGAGSGNGSRQFHITGSSDSHGFYEHPNTETLRVVTVQQVRLDDVLRDADLLKIDTEGAECDVLEGAQRLLSSTPPMLVEWTPDCQRKAGRVDDELLTMLRDLGYNLTVLHDESQAVRDVNDVLTDLRAGVLRPGWYANIACEPRA